MVFLKKPILNTRTILFCVMHILSGFTITNGLETGNGMYNNASSPTIINCTFSGNTDYSYEREAYRQYPQAGRYKITMEAIDPDGLSDTISHYIDVSPWENETGLVRDHRDDQYYGTVKIGDQWWMSENLNFAPTLNPTPAIAYPTPPKRPMFFTG